MATAPLSVLRAKRAGARPALRIYWEAKRAGVPYSWALALVEQESGWQNVFGGDHGQLPNPAAPPFYHVAVTRERVQALKAYVHAGHASNGVGLTQLTSIGLIEGADAMGGAHRPVFQLRMGLRFFRSVTGGDWTQAWRYNGARSYQAQILALQKRWHKIVT